MISQANEYLSLSVWPLSAAASSARKGANVALIAATVVPTCVEVPDVVFAYPTAQAKTSQEKEATGGDAYICRIRDLMTMADGFWPPRRATNRKDALSLPHRYEDAVNSEVW